MINKKDNFKDALRLKVLRSVSELMDEGYELENFDMHFNASDDIDNSKWKSMHHSINIYKSEIANTLTECSMDSYGLSSILLLLPYLERYTNLIVINGKPANKQDMYQILKYSKNKVDSILNILVDKDLIRKVKSGNSCNYYLNPHLALNGEYVDVDTKLMFRRDCHINDLPQCKDGTVRVDTYKVENDGHAIRESFNTIKRYNNNNNTPPNKTSFDAVSEVGTAVDLEKRLNIKYSDIVSGVLNEETNFSFYNKGTDMMGDTCNSQMEINITNYFIKNNIDFKKEVLYSDVLPNPNDKRRFDWKATIHGNVYYIEYFGMYGSNKGKMFEEYKCQTQRKIRDIHNANLTEQCLFIFPNDLKNKTIEEYFTSII